MSQNIATVPTILVVDDNDDFRGLMKTWLIQRGYRMVGADNADQAIGIALREHPDLILMDIGMPEHSGISAIYLIRKQSELKDVPIVVITAYANEDLHRDAIKAGCVECLTKPVDTNRLEALINRLLSRC